MNEFWRKKFILKDEDEDLEKMANLIQLEREYEKVVMIHDCSCVFMTRE